MSSDVVAPAEVVVFVAAAPASFAGAPGAAIFTTAAACAVVVAAATIFAVAVLVAFVATVDVAAVDVLLPPFPFQTAAARRPARSSSTSFSCASAAGRTSAAFAGPPSR